MVGARAVYTAHVSHVSGIFCQLMKYGISCEASWAVAKCHSEGKLWQRLNIRALMHQGTPELRETALKSKVAAVCEVLESCVSPFHAGCQCI